MNMTLKIVAVATLAMFAGCAMPRTSGIWVEKGRLNIEDPAFAANVEVLKDIRELTSEGFLHAQVTVKNTNRTDYECQYRFEWFRANGMIQTHAEMPWRTIVLHGCDQVRLTAVSPVQGTEDFRLSIRRR